MGGTLAQSRADAPASVHFTYGDRGFPGRKAAHFSIIGKTRLARMLLCFLNYWYAVGSVSGMLKGINLDFSQQYLQATLIVSLLSVWVLVGLFYYLNRYTKRDYFTVWTAAWLFYALWLTLSLTAQGVASANTIFLLKQWSVSISAVFLLWGSLRFFNMPVRPRVFCVFMCFLIVWSI